MHEIYCLDYERSVQLRPSFHRDALDLSSGQISGSARASSKQVIVFHCHGLMQQWLRCADLSLFLCDGPIGTVVVYGEWLGNATVTVLWLVYTFAS